MLFKPLVSIFMESHPKACLIASLHISFASGFTPDVPAGRYTSQYYFKSSTNKQKPGRNPLSFPSKEQPRRQRRLTQIIWVKSVSVGSRFDHQLLAARANASSPLVFIFGGILAGCWFSNIDLTLPRRICNYISRLPFAARRATVSQVGNVK